MTSPAFLSRPLHLFGSLRSLWAELRTNRRAAVGLIIIGALIAGYGLTLVRHRTFEMRAAYSREHLQLERLVAISQEQDWPQRAEASAALRSTLEGRLWVAETEGLARADLQAWIGGVGREIGLPIADIRVELSKPQTLRPELRKITATIAAQPSEMAVIALLERIQRAPHLTVVERLHVRQLPNPILELVLVSYARIAHPDPGERR
jgi:hypothetical protein